MGVLRNTQHGYEQVDSVHCSAHQGRQQNRVSDCADDAFQCLQGMLRQLFLEAVYVVAEVASSPKWYGAGERAKRRPAKAGQGTFGSDGQGRSVGKRFVARSVPNFMSCAGAIRRDVP